MNYSINVNKPQPSLDSFTAARRPYPQFVNATYFRNDGEQKFNAMTFEVQRKTGQVTFDAHWTWSSNYDNTLNVENPYSPRFWERDPYTPRQRVVLNAVWQIPVGKGQQFMANAPGIVNTVLGGWQLYWIGYLETGHYFSPTFSGADPSGTQHIRWET